MSDKRYQRKQFLIDKSFQYKHLLLWFVFTIGFMVVVGGIIIAGMVISDNLAFDWKGILFTVHIAIILIALVSIIFSLYLIRLSHRVAGAAYRLEQSIQRIIKRDYDFSIKLREQDYLKTLADDLNELVDSLRRREETITRLASELKYLLFTLAEYEDIPPSINELMVKMDESIKELFPEKSTPTTETRIWVGKDPSAVSDKGDSQPRMPGSNSLTLKLPEYKSMPANSHNQDLQQSLAEDKGDNLHQE